MDALFHLDYWLFNLVNQEWSNAFFDVVMKWLRNEWIWFPLYMFIIAFFIFNFKKNAYWLILFCFITFGTSDLLSSQLIKKNVKRDRPCRNENVKDAKVLVRCGSGYSFTSSHATNHFAIATFLSFSLGTFYRRVRTPLFIWAGVISFAQVYVGLHFPLDVFCGGLLGFSVGLLWAWVFMRYYAHILHERYQPLSKETDL